MQSREERTKRMCSSNERSFLQWPQKPILNLMFFYFLSFCQDFILCKCSDLLIKFKSKNPWKYAQEYYSTNMFTTDISKIPNNAGVYLFKDRKWTILYIGKAKNLQKRLWQYFSPNSLRKQEMLEKADKVDFLMVKNESEALYLEDNMIKQHQPEYNNLLKADNSYVYIKITKESFPQIFLTRKKINDNALYIGPKNDTIQLKKFLQYLRQIVKYRGCKSTQFKQGKLCSDYYFWLCRGRCKLAKTKGPLDKGGKQKGGFSEQISEKIYTLDDKLKIHETLMAYDQADKIFLKARDEAHRFANSYRKKQMSKEFS